MHQLEGQLSTEGTITTRRTDATWQATCPACGEQTKVLGTIVQNHYRADLLLGSGYRTRCWMGGGQLEFYALTMQRVSAAETGQEG
jgi:hypothetical protein